MRVMSDFAPSFPRDLRPEIEQLRPRIGKLTKSAGAGFGVLVGTEYLAVPYRVYGPILPDARPIGSTARTVISCILSRHADGRVRERNLRHLLEQTEAWTGPFVLRLLGEYVVEITELVAHAVAQPGDSAAARRSLYREVLEANPGFTRRLRSQSVSYWNAYYRDSYPSVHDYPATRALDVILGESRSISLSHARGGGNGGRCDL